MHFTYLLCVCLLGPISAPVLAVPSEHKPVKHLSRELSEFAATRNVVPRINSAWRRDGKILDAKIANGTGTDLQAEQENELVLRVRENLIKNKRTNKKKDKARKEAFKKKNKNKNTLVKVIQVISDQRESASNQGSTRYLKHVVLADNGANVTQTVQVTDVETMTISNSTARVNAASRSVITSNDGTEPASTTESPAPQRADPSAPFKLNAQTILEPLGAPAPSAKDVEIDPAANGTVQSSQKANSSGKCAGQVNQEVTDTPIEVRGLDGSRAGPIFAEDTKEMKDVEEEKCKQAKNPGKAPGTSNT